MADEIGRKMLEKMGWKAGEGIGKQKQGTVKPVRLNTQKDARGVGYHSDLFTPWWDDLYDRTAKKVSNSKPVADASVKKKKRSKRSTSLMQPSA